MRKLTGSVSGASLPSLLDELLLQRPSGVLELTEADWTARLGLRDGRVVSASFGRERGLRAVMALSITMQEARYVFRPGTDPRDEDSDLMLEPVLDHVRRWNSGPVVPLSAVPIRTVDTERLGLGTIRLNRSAIQKLLAVDGHSTVRDLIGGEPLPESLRQLADLLDLGLVSLDPTGPRWAADAGEHADAPGNGVTRRDGAGKADVRALAPMTGLGLCPRLGFEDGTRTHYLRPTGLHRCFASGTQQTVSGIEQEDLCLTGEYIKCPRLLAALDGGGPGPSWQLPPRSRAADRRLRLGPAQLPAPSTAASAEQGASSPTDADISGDTGDGLSPNTGHASRRQGWALLPAFAVALGIAAIAAWLYVLAKPSVSATLLAPAPTVVVVTTPAASADTESTVTSSPVPMQSTSAAPVDQPRSP